MSHKKLRPFIVKVLNNTNFRFSFICGINIITHAIFMKIQIVHTLSADWLYGVHIKTFRVYVLAKPLVLYDQKIYICLLLLLLLFLFCGVLSSHPGT